MSDIAGRPLAIWAAPARRGYRDSAFTQRKWPWPWSCGYAACPGYAGVSLLVIPFFGPKVAGMVAILLLVVAMAICWGICGWKMVKEETNAHDGR